MKSAARYGVYCLVLCLILSALPGCSKTARKVSTATVDEASLHSIAGKDDSTSQLADKTPEALLASGFIYLSRRNFTLANMHFVMALKKNPELPLAHIGLAGISQEQGDFDGALYHYDQALALDQQLLIGYIGRAQALRLQGDLNRAIEAINQAMAITPDDVRVLGELAIVYDLMGKETLAEPLYQEILERAPEQASSYNNMGMNALLRKDYATAIVQFEQAASIDPKNARISNNLATAYLLYGDQDTAFDIFKSTVGEAAAYNNIGYLLMTQGKLDEAEVALIMALKINPKYYVKARENLDRIEQMRRRAARQ